MVIAVFGLVLTVEVAVKSAFLLQGIFIVILSWQIHERLKRFEKRSPVPVQEHAASLASDVSDSPQTSFADRHATEDDSLTAEGTGKVFHRSNCFLWYTRLSCHTEPRVEHTFLPMCTELWNVISKLCHLRNYYLKCLTEDIILYL